MCSLLLVILAIFAVLTLAGKDWDMYHLRPKYKYPKRGEKGGSEAEHVGGLNL
jgi:hypothetical protein